MAGKNKLVIVESPAKAKTIAKLLGKGYKVMASNGHIRDLPAKTIGVNAAKDFEPIYCTTPERRKLVRELSEEAGKSEKVFLATDPDREGEAISWHLATVLGIDVNENCRITFNEITGAAVTKAVASPRHIDMDLVNAQQARRILDRLVGYNISPLLWERVQKGLSAGRVQSVAVRILVEREEEIRRFVPKEFWIIKGNFDNGAGAVFEAKYVGRNGKKDEPATEKEAAAVYDALKNARFTVKSLTKKEKKKTAPPPFTTSNLQQEASRKLGFSAQRTMVVAQQLYEGVDLSGEGTVGLVTYIRTDSVRSSAESVEAVRAHILEKYGKRFVPEKPNAFRTKKNAQDAHEAIRPSYMERDPETLKKDLSKDQYKLYKLIYDRFVASQMAPQRYTSMSVDIASDEGLELRAVGSKVNFAGFTAVYTESRDKAEEEEGVLPELTEGQTVSLIGLEKTQHFTEPPSHYTEAALVKELEDKGIGRPSTYAPTISTILERKYVERDGKALLPTPLGVTVVNILKEHFPDIVNTKFTAEMEDQLDDIEFGRKDWKTVLGDFYGPFTKTLETAKRHMERVKLPDKESDVVCEVCGAKMVYKTGRYGTFLACPNYPKCKNTKKIVDTVEVPCPLCGSPLVMRTAKKTGRKFYGCSAYPKCNFISREKPAPIRCPDCGGVLVQKFRKDKTAYYMCTNKECGKKLDNIHDIRQG
ncbi:MAG: type I DNA topoisomerase [Eubacteriales bacterium]|nr:type I DNA topoisomerase [Eubacteriales bacterium]